MQTDETIIEARKHFAAARAMRRNLRIGAYQGRNSGGSAYVMHEDKAGELAATLGRELEGLLWGEHRLAERISENRDAGNQRPELRKRMTTYRRRIRQAYTKTTREMEMAHAA